MKIFTLRELTRFYTFLPLHNLFILSQSFFFIIILFDSSFSTLFFSSIVCLPRSFLQISLSKEFFFLLSIFFLCFSNSSSHSICLSLPFFSVFLIFLFPLLSIWVFLHLCKMYMYFFYLFICLLLCFVMSCPVCLFASILFSMSGCVSFTAICLFVCHFFLSLLYCLSLSLFRILSLCISVSLQGLWIGLTFCKP